MKPGTNQFFDINKLPKEPGIMYYCLSMPLLTTTQSPQDCYDSDVDLIKKLQVSNCGAQVVYTDGLYLYSDEKAVDLKLKHQKLIEEHKRGWMNLILKNLYLIPSGFAFMTWSQLLLETPFFCSEFIKLKEIYESDSKFSNYVKADIVSTGREVSGNTIGYMLEEILADYLVVKGQVHLPNDYTKGKEEWILNCYHGKPHRSYMYLLQKNLLGVDNLKNIYQNCWYDLIVKKLYEFERLDIDTFDFSKSEA